MSAASSNGVEVDVMPPKTLDQRERDACGVGFIANIASTERTHEILQAGIQALKCNDHRGGCNYDGRTGDGAGVMTQIPWEILQKWADKEGHGKLDPEKSAVGVFFLGHDQYLEAQTEVERFVARSPLRLVGWREVPVDASHLGKLARDNAPYIWQVVLEGKGLSSQEIEVQAYALRR